MKKIKMKRVKTKGMLKNKRVMLGAGTLAIVSALTIGLLSNKTTDAFVRDVTTHIDVTPEALSIMGYQEMDYAQAMSYILSRADISPFEVEDMRLEGITLEEHLSNLDAICKVENVNPNVVLSQQIVETATFMFKYLKTNEDGSQEIVESSVPSHHYNFAGIGATDSNPEPYKFENNLRGQVAEVHLLKIYASTDELLVPLDEIDFANNTRAKATSVAGLSKTWASDPNYGNLITSVYNSMMTHEIDVELLEKYAGHVYEKTIEQKDTQDNSETEINSEDVGK